MATAKAWAKTGRAYSVESVPLGDDRGVNRSAVDAVEGDGADELACAVREHDVDLRPELREIARELNGLVCRDSAGDAEQDAASRERPPRCEGRAGARGRRRRTGVAHDQALLRRRFTRSNSMSPSANVSRACVVSFLSTLPLPAQP